MQYWMGLHTIYLHDHNMAYATQNIGYKSRYGAMDKHVAQTVRTDIYTDYNTGHKRCINRSGQSSIVRRHATSVARACNYHVQAIRHLPTTELALTLACSLILPRLDYCNAVLHGAPASSIQKLHRAQNTAARVILEIARRSPSQPLLQQLHWLPVWQRIDYKLAVLMYKIHHTSTPVYLSRHIQPRTVTRCLRSSNTPRVCKLTTRTNFADRTSCCSAPAVWNSLTADIVDSSSLQIFKRKLKTFLLWSPYGIGQTIIFLACGFFFLLFFLA